MKQEFYSNGKLLITGEYVILDGASSLALPTKKGQSLIVETNNSTILTWKSFDSHNQNWYSTEIKTKELLKTTPPKGNSKFDETLFKILWQAQRLNPNFLDSLSGYSIQTHLTFERLWGLGTSSTLINNIANWANVNPFELLNLSFGGSGYDIACAEAKTPILYTRKEDKNYPQITPIDFNPKFKDQIFFVYLNQKKDSKEAISSYRSIDKSDLKNTIKKVNNITKSILACQNVEKFNTLVLEHETTLSSLLKTPTIKEILFNDYNYGSIKSLGAWGGDFIMVTGSKKEMEYFTTRGYHTIIPYIEMILK